MRHSAFGVVCLSLSNASISLQIFEVGDVVLLDETKDVGATNRRHIAALYCGANSGFEVLILCHVPF